MRLTKTIYCLLLLTFIVSHNAVSEEAGIEISRPHPRECISDINYYPFNFVVSNDTKFSPKYSTENLIKSAEKLRNSVCGKLLSIESRVVSKDRNLVFPNHCAVSSLADNIRHTALTVRECENLLTGLDLIEKNRDFINLYQLAEASEAAAVQAKLSAEISDKEVRSITGFSIKDIYLGITRNELLKTGASKNLWSCSQGVDDPAQKNCNLDFVASTTKSCQPITYSNPVYGDFLTVDDCKTKITYLDKGKLPDNIKPLSTIGGERVWSISARFFKDKLYAITFYVPTSPELFEAMKNKYGHPNGFDKGDVWIGATEELKLSKGIIGIVNKSVISEIEKNKTARADFNKDQQLKKAQEISKEKIKDF